MSPIANGGGTRLETASKNRARNRGKLKCKRKK